MQFRIFPAPKDEICTPFVFLKQNNCYSRWYYNDAELKNIMITWDSELSQIRIIGCNENEIFGFRRPRHSHVIKFIN